MKYVPIGFKSDYSLLKSLFKVNDIISYAKNNNSNYVGILDDNPYGIIDFYLNCKKNNLKCIFGLVVNVGNTKIYLYIKNYSGYLNIIKINELVIDNNLTLDGLFKYNDGLIAVIPYENYNIYNRIKTVYEVYLGYKNNMELQNAIKISKNVLFVNEVRYTKKEELSIINVLYKINEEVYVDNDNYIIEPTEYDVKTVYDFVNKIDFELNLKNRYIPGYCNTLEDSIKFLRNLSIQGLNKRLNNNVPNEYKNRLKYELDVIEKMGFVDYFLIVYDYVKYAKKNNIMIGPGRGSAVGSLVSYSLGIIDIDPLKYDLYFERFLNPERVTMPDIDIDVEDIKRKSLIEYITNKYSNKRVALVGAYNTLGARQVIRDVGRTFNIDNSIIDVLSKKIEQKKSLKDNLKNNQELVSYIKTNKLETLYKIAIKLEGLKKNTTIHAAGVVISSVPLNSVIPTYKTSDGMITGVTKDFLEDIGLLKMDLLSITNLSMIHNVTDKINKSNPSFNILNIPLDDKKVFQLFASGNTDNIFQFESQGMRNFLKKLKPTCFDDLIAANALFRPGPMDNIDEYVARKHGKKVVTYLHKDLEPILKSTYGIIVYQEQIMQILSKMGGYSFAEADLIRRAMSKKKQDVILNERIKFTNNARTLGYDESVATKVYDLIVKFANYGFNKSHSVAYALIAYQIAYLRVYYPDIFQMNSLNMNINSDAKIKDIIEEAKNRGLKIVKPDINVSKGEYTIIDGSIILPLSIIKDINSNVSRCIIDNAPYSDFYDFMWKTYNNGINRGILEKLINSGALDSLGYSRNTLLENIDSGITYIELCKSLDVSLIEKPEMAISNIPDKELDEKEVFGFYVSGHPTDKIDMSNIIKIRDIGKYLNRNICMGVLVEKIKVINTKKGEKMAFLDISDGTGSTNAVIFPKSNTLLEKINEQDVIVIDVTISKRNDELQVIINQLKKTN